MAQGRETLPKTQATQHSVQIFSSLTTTLEVAMELTSACQCPLKEYELEKYLITAPILYC